MSRWMTPVLCLGFLTGCAHPGPGLVPEEAAAAHVTAEADRDTFVGGPDWFTGTATVSMLFSPNGPRTFGGANVTFEPGARTAWHVHPAGQTLVVTAGSGWVQSEGEPRRDLKPGDVVWTPPGVRHWHGATDTESMTHLALQGGIEAKVVDWQEHVSDAQYLGGE